MAEQKKTDPAAALNDISLETIDGQRIAGARLGQHRGMRAVKLNEAAAARTGSSSARLAPSAEPVPPELRAAG